jgi:hypothetical protein
MKLTWKEALEHIDKERARVTEVVRTSRGLRLNIVTRRRKALTLAITEERQA